MPSRRRSTGSLSSKDLEQTTNLNSQAHIHGKELNLPFPFRRVWFSPSGPLCFLIPVSFAVTKAGDNLDSGVIDLQPLQNEALWLILKELVLLLVFIPYGVVFFSSCVWIQSKYRQHPHSFKYTAVTDTPNLLHAKFSNQITNEVKSPDGFGMVF